MKNANRDTLKKLRSSLKFFETQEMAILYEECGTELSQIVKTMKDHELEIRHIEVAVKNYVPQKITTKRKSKKVHDDSAVVIQ